MSVVLIFLKGASRSPEICLAYPSLRTTVLAIPISFSRHESEKSNLSAPIPYKTFTSISRKYPQACYLRQRLVNPSQTTWTVQTSEKQTKKKLADKKYLVFTTVGFVLEVQRTLGDMHQQEKWPSMFCYLRRFLRCTRNIHSIPTKLEIYTKIQSVGETSSQQRFFYYTFLLNQNLLPQKKT